LEHSEQNAGSEAFGAYLKRLREGRRLSLDAVEELSTGFPEKVTKSHLSRIENGLALPSFPRLMAMSHIYGVPIASLAERYELELRREMKPVDLRGRPDAVVLSDVDVLIRAGEVNEALQACWALFDRREEKSFGAPLQGRQSFDLRSRVVSCMVLSGRYEYAKLLAEEALGAPGLTEPQRLILLQLLATASYRLSRYTIALLAVEECASGAGREDVAPRFEADIGALRANIHVAMGQPGAAIPLYELAAARYDEIGNAYEAASSRINLAEARCETKDFAGARADITKVVASLEAGSFERLRAIALSVLAKIEYSAGRLEAADKLAVKSNLIARQIEHSALVFKNCYYLWRIAQARGDNAAVRLNERTLKSYLGRIEGDDPEVEAFREVVKGAQS
jgi:transcriptional regulator with XRE-family HTH domain